MKFLFLIFIFLTPNSILWAQAQDNSQACICNQQSDKDFFDQASIVINGTVTAKSYTFPNRIFSVDIQHAYKGVIENKKLTILTSTNKCAVPLLVNKRYVFYINKVIEKNSVYFNKCHLFYELTEKIISEERHIELMNMSLNLSNENQSKDEISNPEIAPKKKLSDLIEGKHDEEKTTY